MSCHTSCTICNRCNTHPAETNPVFTERLSHWPWQYRTCRAQVRNSWVLVKSCQKENRLTSTFVINEKCFWKGRFCSIVWCEYSKDGKWFFFFIFVVVYVFVIVVFVVVSITINTTDTSFDIFIFSKTWPLNIPCISAFNWSVTLSGKLCVCSFDRNIENNVAITLNCIRQHERSFGNPFDISINSHGVGHFVCFSCPHCVALFGILPLL